MAKAVLRVYIFGWGKVSNHGLLTNQTFIEVMVETSTVGWTI
jgi:hypothetical protein